MLPLLVSAALLGMSCGFAPGPLMTVLLTQSLRHGWREGCKVAVVPLITDAPIILFALILASRAAQVDTALGLLSLAGGCFVLHLAFDTFRAKPTAEADDPTRPNSLRKGILTNLLSPHPWLFWMTVGAATLGNAMLFGRTAAVMFLVVFYAFLVGAKVTTSLAVGYSRTFLEGTVYHYILRALGLMLGVFGVLLLRDGVERLFL